MAERDLAVFPALAQLVQTLWETCKNEGSASRGIKHIAPNLFIGSERRGFFHYSRQRKVLLVYAYTGPEDYFDRAACELLAHCERKGYQLNFLSHRRIEAIGATPFTATPFGVVQRMENLREFALDGGAMRRLRNQVSAFQKSGECSVEEFRCGSDDAVAHDIARVIDAWCAGKTKVNPLVHTARAEILDGTLHPRHRLFLTRVDGTLQNVILISPLSAQDDGYLMDLEFYGADMPRGGLEFAIVHIIGVLRAEGRNLLSLGGTYGCRIEPSPNADAEVDKILDDLHKQNIFNDQGNFQFKNKFRPQNRTIYLCRKAGCGNPDSVIDIIMMIADPGRAPGGDIENHTLRAPTDGAPAAAAAPPPARERQPVGATPMPQRAVPGGVRTQALREARFNPLALPASAVDFDLKTDSWAQLALPAIEARMRDLRARLQQPCDVDAELRRVFPYAHFVLTESGRSAEQALYRAWPRKGIVAQNVLFPTNVFHQIGNDFEPKELPSAAFYRIAAEESGKGDMALDALRDLLARDAGAVALVCVELSNNAAGGQPVAPAHLAAIRALLAPHRIKLVLDATRVLENVRLLAADVSHAQDLFKGARELLAGADVVIASLAKDFGIDKGGLIATDDADLAEAVRRASDAAGSSLDWFERKLVAFALSDRRWLETRVGERLAAVRRVFAALDRRGVPLLRPAGAHCVLIDVGSLAPFTDFAHPVPSFVAWLYQETGIRAGAHSVGMQRRNEVRKLARLALPLGLDADATEEIVRRLDAAFARMADIPELVALAGARGAPGELGASYAVTRYHALSSEAAAMPDAPAARVEPPTPAAVSGAIPTIAAALPEQTDVNDAATTSPPAAEGAPSARAAPSVEVAPSAQAAPERMPETGPAAAESVASAVPAPRGLPGAEQGGARSRMSPRAPLDIAIVGMAGRYPKARNVRELWRNLQQGRDCIEELPQERYAQRLRYGPAQRYRGGFIDDIDRFDSMFFNIPPKDAERLDPQERLFVEVAWETLEDAGYPPDLLASEDPAQSVGVYVGAVWAMYQTLGVEEKKQGANHAPSSFLWSIANRVSYWMNFSGPSLTIDTACSSSLTALYLACEAIAAGECGSAIVGGVNLDLHQSKWEINWSGGALSKDGVCRSFGQGANGYVAGEGVGAIYVKPLARALADGDHVYGVIKSIAVNHGGRTSGFVVPNPKAQTRLVKCALARAGVDAASIGYVEAHGTGTELGDPLEIAALGNAFRDAALAPRSCAVGSLKTNIGHLEAAAGVASVCKVLLQMQHRQIAPSLHSAVLNEHIDFAATPFHVPQQLEPWQPRERDGVAQPLCAGVSSFGAGGSNAHLVLQALEPAPRAAPDDGRTARVFPLSARSEAALRECAQRLLEHLADDGAAQPLRDIAFTLQVGRKAFEHRVAVVARTLPELRDGLSAFLAGKRRENVALGSARNADPLLRLMSRGERDDVIALLSRRGDAGKIARLWADGLLQDWRSVGAADGGARRVSLPTYPFADKRHWVPAGPGIADTVRGIHALIDSNESTFERQLFRKEFHDGDFFIHDHRVMGVPTLPGVAYLELARKAGELAAGRPVRRLRNVLWVSPIAVQDGKRASAFVELKPTSDAVLVEVFGADAAGNKVLHSQCKLAYTSEREAAQPDDYVDLAAVKARCTPAPEAAQAYPRFKAFGLDLGPSFRSLREIYRNERETLGLLELPESRRGDLGELALHPSLVDGALQAGVAAQLGTDGAQMLVPFSLGEVEILHPLPARCWSYVTESNDAHAERSRVSRKNVLILDDSGKVLVRIREATGVPIAEVHKAPARAKDDGGAAVLYYVPQWQSAPLPADAHDTAGTVLLFGVDEALSDAYRAALEPGGGAVVQVRPGDAWRELDAAHYEIDPAAPGDFARLLQILAARGALPQRVVFAWTAHDTFDADGDALAAQLARGIRALLHLCRALHTTKLDAKLPLLYVYGATPGTVQPQHEAVAGFFRSLALEFPKIQGRVLELPLDLFGTPPALVAALRSEFGAEASDIAVRHGAAGREVRRLAPHVLPRDATAAGTLRERGAYLITGGAGGLGLIFAQFLARTCRARLLLSGRSAPTPELEARLDALRAAGADVVYVAADITRRADVDALVARCKAEFGALHGVIHSAGVLRDAYVRNKDSSDFDAVLAPKVAGTLLLDAATAAEPLDFFVLFSSLAALGGNAGQSDYAYANHFMDSFAHLRAARCAAGTRGGRTLSLNWSLWADGGMKVDAQTEQLFTQTLGLKLLGTAHGERALLDGLAANVPQLAVVEGVQEKIETAWGLRKKPVAAPAPAAAAPQPSAALVEARLTEIATRFLKLDAADVAPDGVLLDLGFDSIGLTTYANEINTCYGVEVTPVLFFDYPSIREVARYLCSERADAVARVHAAAADTAPPSAPAAIAPAPAHAVAAEAAPVPRLSKGLRAEAVEASHAAPPAVHAGSANRFAAMPIAIVGMAGVMPQSDDLREFWRHLAAGDDLITEIPRERWNWEDFYGDPFKETNKSNSKWGGFMREVDKFDAAFFGISRREAQMMDPQQRIFLETVWKAIEDSGHRVSDLSGTRTGLFVGVATNDYVDLMNRCDIGLDGYSASGNSHSVLANRISFLLNLRGPSAPIDTACSSSLVALHRAIESIHTGSCDMAIVGGVQVMLSPAAYISFGMAGMLSSDGRCKTFDKRANGYVRGEGSGAILLKMLAAAEADGDHVYAVIRATAENHGGRVTTLTAPNSAAQTELLIEAYEKANVDPATVGFIECHGTGTGLGDPIEIQALSKAFAALEKKRGRAPAAAPYCGLSSAKTNIGHLETAAGIAGILRVLLAMHHRQIPANVHFEELNPYITLGGSPFYIAAQTRPWEAPRAADGSPLPRRAGVSSFGFGGANAHIVLEEYPQPLAETDAANGPHLIVLSAKSDERLRAYAAALIAHLDSEPTPLLDLAYTLQIGRDAMPVRLALVARDATELRTHLQRWLDGDGAAARVGTVRAGKPDSAAPVASSADIDTWLAQGALDRLADAWLLGADMDWKRLARARVPRRVSAPTYPFARERYWFADASRARPGPTPTAVAPAATTVSAPAAAATSVASAPVSQDGTDAAPTLYYIDGWQPAALHATASSTAAPGDVVVLVRDAAGRAVFERCLAGHAGRTVWVLPGGDWQSLDGDSYQVAPHDRDDFNALFAALLRQGIAPRVVIHAWSGGEAAESERGIDEAFRHSIGSVLPLMQALLDATARGSAPPQLVYLSRGAPHDAAVAAFARSVRLERRDVAFTAIETDGAIDAWLADELHAAGDGVREIRYRGGERTVRAWRSWSPAPAGGTVPIRQRGCYVISGGLGGLGLIVARHWATQAQVRLALLGRSAPDAKQRAALAELERLGAEVIHLAVDVADAEQTETALQQVRARFGRIDGIVHAAGVIGYAPLAEKNADELRRICAAKIHGARHLDRASCRDALDFFLAFGSLAGVLGSPGQGDYAFANAWLDGFAAEREALVRAGARSGRSLTIDWPLWRDGGMQMERVLGIALDAKTKQLMQQSSGIHELDSVAALAALDACLLGAAARVLVMSGDRARIDSALGIAATAAPRVAAPAARAASAVLTERAADAASHELSRRVQRELARLAAEVLLVEAETLAADVSLSEYGLDSIGAAAYFRSLNARFGLQLAPALLFEYPTLEGFGTFLLNEHAASLAAALGTTAQDPAPAATPQVSPTSPAALQTVPVRAASAPHAASAGVAVIGMAGVFPGADSPDALWRLLRDGVDPIGEVPPQRWRTDVSQDAASVYRWGGFLDDVAAFDAAFFGIGAHEAALMDPQQRLFLETAWNAIEHAGHRAADLAGTRTGVFVGMSGFDYLDVLRAAGAGADAYGATGMAHCLLPNRVSYWFDLRGPSEAIDTACSSSLVAVHRAAQAIADGSCDFALAGGVNVLLSPSLQAALGTAGLLAADGRCKTFDRRADGYVRSEGCAAVLLKRLDLAEADGDAIYGVIRGSGVNHGGRAMALTAPNPNAQAELIADVYTRAGINPAAVGLIETHGTGTALGDAVEINGLKKAFRQLGAIQHSQAPVRCALGALKSQIGHLEAASGVAALIKVLLALEHRCIPGRLHLTEPNPQIALDDSPFHFAAETAPWPTPRDASGAPLPLTAGISAFGFGGVNAHVVVEQHRDSRTPREPKNASQRTLACAFVLSAKTPQALQRRAQHLLDWLPAHADADPARVAFTLQAGRSPLPERLAISAESLDELASKLHCWLEDIGVSGVHRGVATGEASLAAIDRDAQLKRAIADKWLASGELDALLALWAQGVDLDWAGCYDGTPPLRIALPTYPFARERHWLDAGAAAATPVATVRAVTPPQDRAPTAPAPSDAPPPMRPATIPGDPVEALLRRELSQQLRRPAEQLALDRSLLELGANSLGIAALVRTVNEQLGVALSPSVLFEHPTIARFAAFLRTQLSERAAAPAGAPDADAPPQNAIAPDAMPLVEADARGAATHELLQKILWQDNGKDEEYEKLTF